MLIKERKRSKLIYVLQKFSLEANICIRFASYTCIRKKKEKRMSRALWSGIVLSLVLSGCITQAERAPNRSEDTILSKEVRKLLAQNDGVLDLRENPTVGCTRVRLVGTHRVKRFCYTNQEEKDAAMANQNAYYGRFGPQSCLDGDFSGCQNGLDEPRGSRFGRQLGPG